MTDVQLEDGYTRIANELLDIIPKYKFNGSQLRIIMVVWRFTYGFHRKDHEMALSFFVDATHLGKTQIDRELTTLIESKVLAVTKEPTYTTARRLGFNKSYHEWKIEYSQQKQVQSAKTLTVSEKSTGQSANIGTQTVSKNADQERYSFKDILKDKITTTILESDEPEELGSYQKQIKELYEIHGKEVVNSAFQKAMTDKNTEIENIKNILQERLKIGA